MKKSNLTIKIFTFIIVLFLFGATANIAVSAASSPKAPEKLTSTQSTNKIKLTWKKVKDASGYRIYYKLPADLSWRTAVKSTTSTSYTFKNLLEGQYYQFAVRSYIKSGSKTLWSDYKSLSTATLTSSPKKITAKQTNSSITLSWSKVDSATGYRIYYKTTSSDTWKKIVNATKNTNYTIKNLTAGEKYTFCVRSYKKHPFGNVLGKSSSITTSTLPKTLTVQLSKNTASSITLSWKKVTADGYRIYYRVSSGSWKTAVKSTTKTRCTIKNLSVGKTYEFAVRPYIKIPSGIVLGNYKTIKITVSSLSASPLAQKALEIDYKVPKNFKIGFICLHDETTNYDLNFIKAIQRIKKTLNLSDDQVIIKINVPESNECYTAAKDLARKGCKIIFANSFGHESFMIKAAEEFPSVHFCHATGVEAHISGLSNYHNAYASAYETHYLTGIAAGLKLKQMIDSGKIKASEAIMGYVGSYTYAEVISAYSAFFLGAKSVCPSVTMKVLFTGSWCDITEEKNAAEALIARGCKLISQYSDSMGAPSVCEYEGVPNISYNCSTYDSCPKTFIVSSYIDWSQYFNYIIGQYSKNKDIATDWCGGIADGAVVLSGINESVAAKGTYEKIKSVAKDIASGKIIIFNTKSFTVNGKRITSYLADINPDKFYTPDTQVVYNNQFFESFFRSSPYFDLRIDGITLYNEKF